MVFGPPWEAGGKINGTGEQNGPPSETMETVKRWRAKPECLSNIAW